MKTRLKTIQDLYDLVNEVGFMPLFDLGEGGFSVERLTFGQWWTGREDDPWFWREQAAREGEIIYGKVFAGRAGFVSKQWYPVLANYRRDGYDFDSRWEEGLAAPLCRDIMRIVETRGRAMTAQIKREVGAKGFESALTLLQGQTYLLIGGFERKRNRRGEPYGWNIAEMMTPEAAFGTDWVTSAYHEPPQVSAQRIKEEIICHFPWVKEQFLKKILG